MKLAALTALLNSNLEKINLLEYEKLSLLESELRNPQPVKEVSFGDLITEAVTGTGKTQYKNHIKTRREIIQDEIKELKTKNIEFQSQIVIFLKNTIDN